MNWKPLQSWSLKSRVTLFTLSVFLIGVWSLAFYASGVLREDMQRQLGEQQFSTVSLLAVHVGEELESRLRALEAVASTISPALLGNEAELQAQLEQRPIFRMQFNGGIVAVRSDGTTIADVPLSTGRLGVNYMDREVFAEALKQGKTGIGRPVRGRKLPGPLITMAAPIKDRQGKVIGALAGTTDLSRPNFLDKITGSKYGNSGGYIIADRKHRLIVTASDKSRAMEELPAPGVNQYIDRRMQGNDGYEVIVTARGVEVLTSAKGVPVANWSVVVSLPTEEAFAPIRAMRNRMLSATTLLTLLVGILVWWTAWRLLRRELSPLIAATRTLDGLSGGSVPLEPIPVTRKDEIGDLINGFNRLLASLKRQGEELKASESRARAIVDASPAPLAMNDDHGTITYLNRAFVQVLGYTLNDIPTLADWWPRAYPDPQYRQWVAESWQRALEEAKRTGSPFIPIECSIHCKDDSVRTFLVGAAGLEKQFAGLHLVILYDITERKRLEVSLADSEEHLRKLVAMTPVGVFEADRDGKCVFANERWLEITGLTLEAAIGDGWANALHPDDRDRVYAEWHRLATEGRKFNVEYRFRRPDGKVSWVVGQADKFGSATDAFLGYVGSITDITERKEVEMERARLEAQLSESQKMEALGTLAGGVAHDFNNALAAILGNVELARQDVGAGHPALVSLEEIGKASRRAKDLVQQILAFSRRQTVERKPMSLALVVVETARLIRATLPAMVSLNVNCEGDAPAVLADATQMEQVLLNLCSNGAQAVDGIGRPGVIEINLAAYDCTRSEAYRDFPAGRYACLTVRDNGLGMDEATRARVFDPFFTTKPAGKGTGLGLSVVHGIVQAHEARIEVESVPGQGSAFRIYFPAVEAQIERVVAPSPEVTPAQGQGKHVLYLDDEEAIIFLMKRLLERRGYRVSGYTEPRQALEAVRANPNDFDLAVTDYYMPGMSGLEVARALNEIHPDLPVVMASGYINEDLRAKAPAAGIRELIYKPNTVEDLCEAVARFANARI